LKAKSVKTIQNARELRKSLTGAEQRLWYVLRNRQSGVIKFRRQHPIGKYIVDFYCPQSRLIIEVDGDSHGDSQEYDRQRTEWLKSQGYQVIRFSNREVKEHFDTVIAEILFQCESKAAKSNED
jgi:very-short-patch-repair endonuclease